ncbi:MAG TPA: trypsin-like peptidase domain-containing protein [Opitutaceae bacterium]|nr:trypsin-like peptidase domain-containing protein [Opitutaceae bacterium]
MPSLTLTRLTGFDRNKKTSLDQDLVVLGTDPGADLRFDPTWDKTVAPRHLTLEHKGGAWWAKDASKDGTFVGGKKIGLEKLAPGAVLELGRGGPKVQVDFAGAAAPVPAAARPAAPVAVAEPPPVATPVLAEAAARPASKPPGSGPMLPVLVVAAVLAVAAIGGAAWFFLARPGGKADAGGGVVGKTPEQALADVAREYSAAVGLVVIVHPRIEGGKPTPMATAWAVGPRVFATNSHVSKPVQEVLANGGSAYVVINRSPDKKLKIVQAVVHPRYEKPELNFEGKQQAVPAYDVGLLYVDEDAPKFFRVARRAELEKLDSGYRIGYLGFPMEGMAGGGVEMRSPVATMQSGIVTSTTDYWLASAAFEKRLLVQHNLGATGGASGSPIFNSAGEIVALLNAGNIIGSVSFDTGEVARAPSGVMVNFAQRVDLLRDIWPAYPKD